MRLGRSAEAEGKLSLAKSAYAAAMPYIHARPQSVALDIEAVADLVHRVSQVKRDARRKREKGAYVSLTEILRMNREQEETAGRLGSAPDPRR
jgi:hypothetical protein